MGYERDDEAQLGVRDGGLAEELKVIGMVRRLYLSHDIHLPNIQFILFLADSRPDSYL